MCAIRAHLDYPNPASYLLIVCLSDCWETPSPSVEERGTKDESYVLPLDDELTFYGAMPLFYERKF